MLPRISDWKSWTPLDKISYVAQASTVVSFAAASWFSYQSWQEARLAREDQKRFFIEEKSPELIVTNVSAFGMDGADGSIIQVTVKNTGASEAKNLRVVVQPSDLKPETGPIDPMMRDPSEVSVPRGREKEILAAIIRLKGRKYRWQTDTIRLYTKESSQDYEIIASLFVSYEGSFGDRHHDDYMVIAKPRK